VLASFNSYSLLIMQASTPGDTSFACGCFMSHLTLHDTAGSINQSVNHSMLLLNQTTPVFGIRGVASRESTHNDWQSTCSQHYMFEHILASEHRRDCSSNDVVMEGAGTLTPLASPSSTCYDNHVIRASHGLVQLQRKEDGSVMCLGKRNLMVSQ